MSKVTGGQNPTHPDPQKQKKSQGPGYIEAVQKDLDKQAAQLNSLNPNRKTKTGNMQPMPKKFQG